MTSTKFKTLFKPKRLYLLASLLTGGFLSFSTLFTVIHSGEPSYTLTTLFIAIHGLILLVLTLFSRKFYRTFLLLSLCTYFSISLGYLYGIISYVLDNGGGVIPSVAIARMFIMCYVVVMVCSGYRLVMNEMEYPKV
jgi:hypothetical protein